VFSYQYLDEIRMLELETILPLFPPGARILEIGGGTGRQALELSRRGFEVTAIDLALSSYAARRVFPVIDYDGATIPLPDASVDVVFSSNVLEHVDDLAHMHSEIRRLLAPNGKCIHVLPTHVWRFWSLLAGYPDAIVYFLHGAPSLVPRALPARLERARLAAAWYRTARDVGGRLLPPRHGARGNTISEISLFHPSWWRRNFQVNGFTIVHDAPTGLFHTGNMLLGPRLGLARRRRLAGLLGSTSHVFLLKRVCDATPERLTAA
jgi:SAM-dependent methyltransferase